MIHIIIIPPTLYEGHRELDLAVVRRRRQPGEGQVLQKYWTGLVSQAGAGFVMASERFADAWQWRHEAPEKAGVSIILLSSTSLQEEGVEALGWV